MTFAAVLAVDAGEVETAAIHSGIDRCQSVHVDDVTPVDRLEAAIDYDSVGGLMVAVVS